MSHADTANCHSAGYEREQKELVNHASLFKAQEVLHW